MAAYATFYITCANETEAQQLAKGLIEHKLAACVNILSSIQSYYEWEGALQSANESALLVKSRHDLSGPIIDFIKQNHSYGCPCIVEWPVLSGHEPFLRWIDQQTSR